MSDDRPTDDPRALWRAAPDDLLAISVDDLRALAASERGRMRRLALAQYAGTGVGLAGFAAVAVRFADPVMRAGAVLLVLVFVHLLLELRRGHRRRSADLRASPADPCVAFYRAELARQRDLSSGPAFRRRLLVGVPSGVLFFLGFARAQPRLAPAIYAELAAFLVGVTAATLLARRRARGLQRQIDELDALDVSR